MTQVLRCMVMQMHHRGGYECDDHLSEETVVFVDKAPREDWSVLRSHLVLRRISNSLDAGDVDCGVTGIEFVVGLSAYKWSGYRLYH